MMGLIGSALQGGAQAANEIAENSLAKKREQALLKLREGMQKRADERQHNYRLEEGEVQQGYNLDTMDVQQGYTQDNARLQHEMSMGQERFRQNRQDDRTRMSIDARTASGTSSDSGLPGDSDDIGWSDSELRQRYDIARKLEEDLRQQIERAKDIGETERARALQHELDAATLRRAELESRVFSGVGGNQPSSANAQSSDIMDVDEYINSFLN